MSNETVLVKNNDLSDNCESPYDCRKEVTWNTVKENRFGRKEQITLK